MTVAYSAPLTVSWSVRNGISFSLIMQHAFCIQLEREDQKEVIKDDCTPIEAFMDSEEAKNSNEIAI